MGSNAARLSRKLDILELSSAGPNVVTIWTQMAIGFISSLAGLVGAFSGHLIIALFATYIIRNLFWVSGGSLKISEHVFISGSFVALASALLVPLGYWIGHKRILSPCKIPDVFIMAHLFLQSSSGFWHDSQTNLLKYEF